MSNTVLPNTFQCFNIYIDHALEHLTDSEVRILWYATRHILGWRDKIKNKQGHISLSMFENGFTDSNGNHYGGCGLGKGAIIAACKSLVEFKLLQKTGKPTEDGQGWELTTDDIQWDKLKARTAERLVKQKNKTLKATAAMVNKRAGTSDVPEKETVEGGTSDVTMQGTSDVTMQGNVARTESNPLSNPSSNLEELNTSAAIATDTQTDSATSNIIPDAFEQAVAVVEAKIKKERTPDLVFEAVAFHIFDIDPSTVTKETGGRIGPIAQWLKGKSDGLKRAGGKVGFISRAAEPEHVKQFALWYKLEYPDANLPYDLVKFVESWRKWATAMAKRAATRQKVQATIVEIAEPTQAEREELALALQTIRPEWEKVGAK